MDKHRIQDRGPLCVERKRRERRGTRRSEGNGHVFNRDSGSADFHSILSGMLKHFINIL